MKVGPLLAGLGRGRFSVRPGWVALRESSSCRYDSSMTDQFALGGRVPVLRILSLVVSMEVNLSLEGRLAKLFFAPLFVGGGEHSLGEMGCCRSRTTALVYCSSQSDI